VILIEKVASSEKNRKKEKQEALKLDLFMGLND